MTVKFVRFPGQLEVMTTAYTPTTAKQTKALISPPTLSYFFRIFSPHAIKSLSDVIRGSPICKLFLT